MLSVTSRWKVEMPSKAKGISVASGEGGAVVFDERGMVTFFDARGNAVWSVSAEDSLRRVRIADGGKGAFLLTVRELSRLSSAGQPLWKAAPPPFPIDLAARSDGTLAVAADSGTVRAYLPTGKEMWTRRLAHPADYVSFGPRAPNTPSPQPALATTVVAVARRGDVTLLDATGHPIWTANLGCEAFRPDPGSDRLVVPSFDGVYAFGLDGSNLGVYDVGAPTTRAIFGAGGDMLLVLDAKRKLSLLDTATGDTRWHLSFEEDPLDVSFSPDGTAIVIARWSGELEWLDVADVEKKTGASPAAAAKSTGAFLEVGGISAADVIAPSGPRIAPKPRWRTALTAHDAVLALVPAGVAVLDRDEETLSLWTGEPLPKWAGSHMGPTAMLSSSRDGSTIVAAGPRGLRIFHPDRGEIGNAAVAAKVTAIAADGSSILVGAETTRLHLFDGRGKPLWDVPTRGFTGVSISPDGANIAVVRGGSISLQVRGGKGGFSKAVAPDGSVGDVMVQTLVIEDAVAWCSRTGRAGLLSLGGQPIIEDVLPPGFPPESIHRAGDELIVVTRGGNFRIDRKAKKVAPLPAGPARRPETRAVFSCFMDRLLEIRYDSREIACVESLTGAVLWRRAVGESPRALQVSVDGAALAGIVAGELVLYDLVIAAPESSPAGPGTPPAETPPSFLEL